jgi:hypothetical protein
MKSQQALAPAVLGAVGVVFGDIGTSPLYALGSALTSAEFVPGESFKVLGLCSLIFWALLIMVTVKYVGVVMRADNAGEGGVLSLVALVQNHFGTAAPWVRHAVSLGVLGTALFYCDSLITPAISVLSAVEGLEILDPNFSHAVLPVTLVVIVILFTIQRRGTGKSRPHVRSRDDAVVRDAGGARRRVHRPDTAGAAGGESAVRPAAAGAPHRAGDRGARRGDPRGHGCEALYADMGHFRPQAGAAGLAGGGVARAGAQLLRPGRADHPRRRGRGESLLLDDAAGDPAAAGAAVHRGRRSSHRRP